MDDIGADIKSTWEFNDKGDLMLVNDEENMVQSITNRLTCWLHSMDLYYNEYGSVLPSFLGWKKEEETLSFMKIEIENTLKQDPRMPEYDLNLRFDEDYTGKVLMDLTLHYNDNSNLELSLVISEDGSINVIDDDVNEELED